MRLLFIIVLIFTTIVSKSQCPQVFDFEGNATLHPYWYDCNGGTFEFNLQSPNNWNSVSIQWGDGSDPSNLTNWTSGTPILHTYAEAVDTFVVTINNNNGCSITGVVVMEQAASASIQVPASGITQGCAPQTISFINSSTNVSQTTTFRWDFGDSSADLIFDANNVNTSVSHLYEPGTVNCETMVTLLAENYCNTIQGGASFATFNPIRIWDTDVPNITVPNTTLCYPDTIFSFTNSAQKNCFTQGNIFQRQEKWNFGDYWGTGVVETDWIPFPPNLPQSIAFPGIGEYTVSVLDSNFCGIETDEITIQIVNPPSASFTINQDTVCVGQNITFLSTAIGANESYWNFTGDWIPSNGGTMNFSFSAPGVYQVSFRAVQSLSPNSCADTATQSIVVLDAPTTQILSQSLSGCDSLHVELTQNSTGNPVTFVWTLPNNTTSIGPTLPPFELTDPGNYSVSLEVTASNGCSASDTENLQVVTTPTAQFTQIGVCQNTPITLLNTSGPNNTPAHWTLGDGFFHSAFSPIHSYAQPGNYSVQLIAGIVGCQDTVVQTVTIAPTPTVQFTPNQTNGCTPFGVVFNNNSTGTVSQNWTFGDNTTSLDFAPSHVFLTSQGSSSNYTVTLSGTSADGCTAQQSSIITVNSGAFANFLDPNNVPECSPHTSHFINSSQAAVSYSWDFGDGNSSNEFQPSHTFENNTNLVGFFTVQLIAYSSGACHDTTERTVVVFPSATFDLDFSSNIACSPSTVPMPLLTGAATFHWDFGDGSTSSDPLPVHVFQTNEPIDTFQIAFIGTSVFGCSDTSYSQLVVLGSPHAAFQMSSADGCEPVSVVFNNLSSEASNYQWDFQDGAFSNSMDSVLEHTFTQEGDFLSTYLIQLIATSSNGCTDTASAPFTLHPQATALFNPTVTENCAPFNCLFQNNSTGSTLFEWDLGDGNLSNAISPSHVYSNLITQDTSYLVTLIASNGFGCTDTASQEIQVNRTPVAYYEITDTSGCYPMTITFANQSIGADTYSWNYGTGENSINADSIHQHNFFNLTDIAVTNAVVLAAMTDNGCFSTYTQPVLIPPGLTANFNGDLQGCHPFSTLFLNNSIGAVAYHWDFGDGSSSNATNPNHTFLLPSSSDTTFTVTLTATNAMGCTQEYAQLVQVYAVPLANISAVSNPLNWPNSAAFVNSSISSASTNYLWDFGDGTLDFNALPAPHFYSTWGNYNVLMIANNGQCSDTAYLNLSVLAPDPIAGFYGDTIGCAPLTVAFQDTSQFANGWLWDFGDGGTTINASPVYTFDTPGTYTVQQIIFGFNGTADTAIHQQAIIVHPRAQAIFTVSPPQITVPQQPIYIVNLSENATSYVWDFDDGDTSHLFTPEHYYTEPGLYDITLMVNNEYNCPDTLVMRAAVRAVGGGSIAFPDAFTPLVDGATDGRIDVLSFDNDVFFPKFEGVKNYELSVYNKWGELIFHSDDINIGWDGYYKGEICQQDLYIWKSKGFFQDGQSFELSGKVTLIRK